MITAEQVAVVIPTRGDVPLKPVLDALAGHGFADGYIWNNATEHDLCVYARYEAIAHTTAPVILTQDDDAILPPETIAGLLAAYEPGKVVCNVPERFRKRYHDSGLVGFGAVFDRDLPWRAFQMAANANLELAGDMAIGRGWFRRECDIIFTMLTPMVMVDLPYTELPYATDDTRLYRQNGHSDGRERMRELCREITKTVAA